MNNFATHRQQFASRLRAFMELRQLSGAEVARRMSRFLGQKFVAVNLSHYRAGRSLPRPRYVAALCAALDIEVGELMPTVAQNEAETVDLSPQLKIVQLSNGNAYLQINQRLAWPAVISVIEALKRSADDFDHSPRHCDDDDEDGNASKARRRQS